ncbi:MAG TPA: thermonuclease family protein [Candidatus Nanoarchaeia archaeon]|nr:hypothetical protein [uncultured archaeon]
MREKLFYPLTFLVIVLGVFLLVQGVNDNKSDGKKDESKTSVGGSQEAESSQETATSQEDLFLVTKVVDGDTIEIEGGKRVRYIGIDTPETVDPREEVQCFGKEASEKNKQLVENKKVKLEKDVSEFDQYSRLLRYIYVGNTFVNELLVKEGFARASSYPPDVKYQDKLSAAEQFARENNKGLWSACGSSLGVQSSESYRLSPLSGSSGCNIKGNISVSTGEKIYHMPGQRKYNDTVVNEEKGERWFCSEEEAKAAGWRKSKV